MAGTQPGEQVTIELTVESGGTREDVLSSEVFVVHDSTLRVPIGRKCGRVLREM